jgi:Cu/Ag efflux pump CusA
VSCRGYCAVYPSDHRCGRQLSQRPSRPGCVQSHGAPARARKRYSFRHADQRCDLHRITLGALIIALGLLVDDAIIAVEMMVVKMEQGWDRFRAASFAWESTAFPMLTGTLVTATGFLPIGFANSAVGEYAGSIFSIVAIALIASWFVAVIFTPFIGVKLLPDIKVHQNHDPHAVYETRMYRGLRAIVVRQPPHHRGGGDRRKAA